MYKMLIRLCIYVVFVLIVISFLLWWFFPLQFIESNIPSVFNANFPAMEIVINRMERKFPAKLLTSEIIVTHKKQGYQIKLTDCWFEPLYKKSINQKEIVEEFFCKLYGGNLQGVAIIRDKKELLLQQLLISEVDLNRVQWAKSLLQRKMSGKLNLKGEAAFDLSKKRIAYFSGTLEATQGKIDLKTPLLGHNNIAYTTITIPFKYKNDQLQLADATVASPLFNSGFQGLIRNISAVQQAKVNIKGEMNTQPLFWQQFKDKKEIQIIRSRLKEPIHYIINGTIVQPGIKLVELERLRRSLLRIQKQ